MQETQVLQRPDEKLRNKKTNLEMREVFETRLD
jgi:hypothetical protein